MISPSFIHVADDVLPDSLCSRLIEAIDRASNEGYAQVAAEEWRRCTLLSIPNERTEGSEALVEDWKSAIRPVVDKYKKLYDEGTLNWCSQIERPQVIKYAANVEAKQHFHLHADCWSTCSATRQLSIITYLNDVAEGGETIFPKHYVSVPPKRGSVLLFPPAFTHAHLAKPPISGDKYIMTSWLHFHGLGVQYAVMPF